METTNLKPHKLKQTFIIDFDSTFIQVEAMDELAEISLNGDENQQKVIQEIQEITNLGMEGKMSFTQTLEERVKLLKANQKHLPLLVGVLKGKVSTSIERNKNFFKEFSDQIYIVSGGFKEYIDPILELFNIPSNQVFANTFKYDDQGNIVGFDRENVLSNEGGKVALLKEMKIEGEVYVIGDGYNDFLLKDAGLADKFFAFTENVQRDIVSKVADHVAPCFDEFLYTSNLPMNISYPKSRIKVLLLENIHPSALDIFGEEGYQVECVSGSLDEAELCEKIKDVSIIGIRSKTQVSAAVLKHANRLLAVGAFCIGTNQIALQACSQKGVVVFNAPYSNTRSVVELAIGEMIMLNRRIFNHSTNIHEGNWHKSAANSNEIRGKKLGIVGYGNIGSQLSVIAEMLGLRVYYYDTDEKLSLGNAVKCKTLKELLNQSDIVTMHVDGDVNNNNIIGEKEFEMMKDGVIFLNLSRGFVVDINALASALKSGKVRGASVDVYPEEPKASKSSFETVLKGLDNVILTPHIGGSTAEAQANIGEFVPQNIINYINTGNLAASVNMPSIQLPEFENTHRLIHIHRNEPGVLAEINNIFAKHKINITGQYLRTNETIGYVITDVSRGYTDDLIPTLKGIEHTLRFRVLY